MSPSRSFWLVCTAAYGVIAALYWPTVARGPIGLDDISQLQQLSHAHFGQVFDYDRFGHLRPVKSALFWVLSRRPEWLAAWRVIALGCVLASAGLAQTLWTPLLRSRGWALVAAMCWASNPITLSVLCWLSTANISICLLGILAYLYLAERAVTSGRPVAHAVGAVASLLLGVSSHELGIVAPALWFAYRRCGASASADRRWIARLALASALCIGVFASLHLTQAAPAIAYRSESQSRAQLMLHAPRYLLENLRLWFWLPGRFGVLLAEPPAQPVLVDALGWLALVAAFAWWWRRLRGRDRALDFALSWCVCLLLPVLNFIPFGNTPVAVHYLYLPGLGLALGLTRGTQRLVAALHRSSWLPALALGVLVAAWLPEQRRTLAAFRTAETLYTYTLANYPDNVEARVNLVASYLDLQKYVEARALLERSLPLAPHDIGLISNRFKLLAETGEPEEALAFHDTHPELNSAAALIQRGRLLLRVHRSPEAVEAFSRALARARDREERYAAGYQLATVLVQVEQYGRARALIDRLLVEFPDRPELLFSKRLLTQLR